MPNASSRTANVASVDTVVCVLALVRPLAATKDGYACGVLAVS